MNPDTLAWEDRLADVRGVHSIEPTLPGVRSHPNLFRPRKIGGLEAANPVKYAACSVSNFNNPDGTITEREYARMEVVARTGCGIITNQGAYPDRTGYGKAYIRQLSIAEDRFIPGFARVADMIHDAGALGVQQILHAGRYGGIDLDHTMQPSDVPQTLRHFRPPKAMSVADIEGVIEDHGQAARRACEAGFDGVEITSFMGYLLSNFLSPFTNTRTDRYGGDLEGRGRFMVELMTALRGVIGDQRMLWVRLNGAELMDDHGGNSEADCLEFMKMAERAGVDGISLVVGWHESTRGALGRHGSGTRRWRRRRWAAAISTSGSCAGRCWPTRCCCTRWRATRSVTSSPARAGSCACRGCFATCRTSAASTPAWATSASRRCR
jgi:2,4-dienoyl-CoA reductase (NADPH2)